jgi:chemotaxis protein MotB
MWEQMSRRGFYRRNMEQAEFWPSFADIMTTVSLVFFFIMLVGIAIVTIKDRSVTSEYKRIKDTYAEIDNIAKERTELYERIERTLKSTSVGETVVFNRDKGRLEINAKVLFAYDDFRLTEEGRQLASQMSGAFLLLLSSSEYKDKIKSIEVRGHTDNVSDGEYNRTLSAERAVSFVNAMVPKSSEIERKYGRYFKASGMSKFEVIAGTIENQSEEERALNRRIEIYINFDDMDISEAIIKLLKSQKK